MDEPKPLYRREFFKSPHHAALGLAALGSSCVLGPQYFPLSLLAGAAAYVLGWVYMPDFPFFRRWVDRRRETRQQVAAQAEIASFLQQRDALLAKLSATRRHRYQELAGVCRDIETAAAENPLTPDDPANDPRLRKLDELMWTYLRLLSIEESLDRFLETESREEVPRLLTEAEAEVAALTAEVDALKTEAAGTKTLETRERLLASRFERLEVLRKRQERIEQARGNHALVLSEQERLDQQIKLIRADGIATRNTANFTARIDATVDHLTETHKWLAEMEEFRDLVGGLPTTPGRVGYQPVAAPAQSAPPPLPQQVKQRR